MSLAPFEGGLPAIGAYEQRVQSNIKPGTSDPDFFPDVTQAPELYKTSRQEVAHDITKVLLNAQTKAAEVPAAATL